MLIYSEKITPRLQYITETLLGDGPLTMATEEFYNFKGTKINYSHKRFSDEEFHIQPSGLLSEQGIGKKNIRCSRWNGLKIFFAAKGDLPFDIFSAAFYLLSRYEEYLPHKKDSYGRFAHSESLAFKEDFLRLPLINLWLNEFNILLQKKFSGYSPIRSSFNYQPTYDIDIAYACKGKGWLRKLAMKLRGATTKLNGKDPFDVYGWLKQLHETHKLSPVYFFLLAKQRSKHDKNLSSRSPHLRGLISKLSSNRIGIHRSAFRRGPESC